MKRIYYLLALLSVAFTACQKQPVVGPDTYAKKGMEITLPASTAFASTDDAADQIPGILNTTYPQLGDGSSATVTFTLAPIKPADSLLTAISYTPTPADYATAANANPKFPEFSTAQALAFMKIKYPDAKPNQLVFLTYIYYESGVTSAAIPDQKDTFLYLNGAWVKCYTLTAAQYNSTGHTFGDFSSTDNAMLPSYFNLILKGDLLVAASAKAGDVKYVSYKYYSGSNFQRITTLTFNGTNWVAPATGTLSFNRIMGKWAVAVNYTLVGSDYIYIGTQTTAGTVAGRASVVKFPDFNTSNTTDDDFWSDDDINAALIAVLNNKYKSTAEKDQQYVVTYTNYSFGKTNPVSKSFIYNGSAFEFYVPPADK